MARLSRMVIPGAPHHVIQRGNRRQPIFSPTPTACSILGNYGGTRYL